MKSPRITAMRTFAVLAAATLAVSTAAFAVAAEKSGKKGAAPQEFRKGAPKAAGLALMSDVPTTRIVAMMDRQLDLTDEQKTKIEDIISTSRKSAEAPAKELKTIAETTREAVRKTLTEEQIKKMESGRRDIGGAVKGFADAHRGEIRERAEGARDEIRFRAALSKLDLTEEQRTKLRETHEAMREKVQALHEEAKPKIEALRKEKEEKALAILTDEQKAEFKKIQENMPSVNELRERPSRFGARGEGRPRLEERRRGPREERGEKDGPQANGRPDGPQFDEQRPEGPRGPRGPRNDEFAGDRPQRSGEPMEDLVAMLDEPQPRGGFQRDGMGRPDGPDARPEFDGPRGPRDPEDAPREAPAPEPSVSELFR